MQPSESTSTNAPHQQDSFGLGNQDLPTSNSGVHPYLLGAPLLTDPAYCNYSYGPASQAPVAGNDYKESTEAFVHFSQDLRMYSADQLIQFCELEVDGGYRCTLQGCRTHYHESPRFENVFQHIVGEIEQRPWGCICKKRYKIRYDCERHASEHNNPDAFRCEVPGCNFARGRKDRVLQHQRAHEGRITREST